MEEKAQAVTEKTPELTEDLQSKAEHHAGKVAEKARPMADQASEQIEGGARRVAKGEHFSSCSPCHCWLLSSCTSQDVPDKFRVCGLPEHRIVAQAHRMPPEA